MIQLTQFVHFLSHCDMANMFGSPTLQHQIFYGDSLVSTSFGAPIPPLRQLPSFPLSPPMQLSLEVVRVLFPLCFLQVFENDPINALIHWYQFSSFPIAS